MAKSFLSKLTNGAFQFISRIPVIGDPLILANTVRRSIPRALAGEWKHAAAEVASGIAQAVLDDLVPVVGRDLGHEIVRAVVGEKYLPDPSLLLGRPFEKYHAAKRRNTNIPSPAPSPLRT
jgi:hypothetical protein